MPTAQQATVLFNLLIDVILHADESRFHGEDTFRESVHIKDLRLQWRIISHALRTQLARYPCSIAYGVEAIEDVINKCAEQKRADLLADVFDFVLRLKALKIWWFPQVPAYLPIIFDFDRLLIAAGQQIFLSEGVAWDVLPYLREADKWARRLAAVSAEPVEPGAPPRSQYALTLFVAREAYLSRPALFLLECRDIGVDLALREALHGKLPNELTDMVVDFALAGRRPVDFPGQTAMPCDHCAQLEREDVRKAEIMVMIECWKKLRGVELIEK